MLQDKIKLLISIMEGTEINEIEVSSFWGAQKIRLQKNHNIDIQTAVQSTVLAPQSPPLAESPSGEPIQSNTDSEPQNIIESNSSNSVEIIAPLVGF